MELSVIIWILSIGLVMNKYGRQEGSGSKEIGICSQWKRQKLFPWSMTIVLHCLCLIVKNKSVGGGWSYCKRQPRNPLAYSKYFKYITELSIEDCLNTVTRELLLDTGELLEFDDPLTLLNRKDGSFQDLVDQTGPAKCMYEMLRNIL